MPGLSPGKALQGARQPALAALHDPGEQIFTRRGEVEGDRDSLAALDDATDQGEMALAGHDMGQGDGGERAVVRDDPLKFLDFERPLGNPPRGDVGHGDERQPTPSGKGAHLVRRGGAPVLPEHGADRGGAGSSGQANEVESCLGGTPAGQNAGIGCEQRRHVAGYQEVRCHGARIGNHPGGVCALRRRDPGRRPDSGVDRGSYSTAARILAASLVWQAELGATALREDDREDAAARREHGDDIVGGDLAGVVHEVRDALVVDQRHRAVGREGRDRGRGWVLRCRPVGHLPVHTGSRFSAKAEAPSRASAESLITSMNSSWRAQASVSDNSLSSSTISFDVRTASGPLAATS